MKKDENQSKSNSRLSLGWWLNPFSGVSSLKKNAIPVSLGETAGVREKIKAAKSPNKYEGEDFATTVARMRVTKSRMAASHNNLVIVYYILLFTAIGAFSASFLVTGIMNTIQCLIFGGAFSIMALSFNLKASKIRDEEWYTLKEWMRRISMERVFPGFMPKEGGEKDV